MKSMRSKTRCRHDPAAAPRGKRAMDHSSSSACPCGVVLVQTGPQSVLGPAGQAGEAGQAEAWPQGPLPGAASEFRCAGELRGAGLGFDFGQFRDFDAVVPQLFQILAHQILGDAFPAEIPRSIDAMPMKKPGRTRGLGLVDAPPDGVAAAFGAGQGHVEQAHALGLGLVPGGACRPARLPCRQQKASSNSESPARTAGWTERSAR